MYELRIEGGGYDKWGDVSKPAKTTAKTNNFDFNAAVRELNRTPEQKANMKELLALFKQVPEKAGVQGINMDGLPELEIRDKEKELISPDSELGKKIAARMKESDRRRTIGGWEKLNAPRNELDGYVPVYAPSAYDTLGKYNPNYKPKLIGYRPLTEEEKSGHINY